jgi:hypothetical protein
VGDDGYLSTTVTVSLIAPLMEGNSLNAFSFPMYVWQSFADNIRRTRSTVELLASTRSKPTVGEKMSKLSFTVSAFRS